VRRRDVNELVEQFLPESRELVEQATRDLLVLEKAPHDRERLDSAFRAFHTLKGGAGIVDFAAMEHTVHAAENVLAAARSGARSITPALVEDCLVCLDQVIAWLDAMQETDGELPPGADAEAATVIARFVNYAAPPDEAPGLPAAAAAVDWPGAMMQRHSHLRSRAKSVVRYTPDADCFFHGEDPVARIAGLPGLLALDLELAQPWPSLDALDPFVCNLVLTALLDRHESEVVAALGDAIERCDVRVLQSAQTVQSDLPELAREVLEAQVRLLAESGSSSAAIGRIASAGRVAANVLRYLGRRDDADRVARATDESVDQGRPHTVRSSIEAALSETTASASAAPPAQSNVAAQTLRVDAARIDALVKLTGELTVANNAIGHTAKLAQEDGNTLAPMLKARHAMLDRLVRQLQQVVLAMRVLPLRHVFQRFPRLVRELSAELQKPAELVIEGEDTEADKAIVEMLFEPLLHVLRNAIDHGIEQPAVRAAHGKAPVATIHLRAARRGEHVVVEVSDDGRGIDVARVREVARERGLVSQEALAAMNEAELLDLVFLPGFSTSCEVTGLSGRGVGMDSVRTAVQRLAGQVVVDSRAGEGTTVRFTLPFSVMMTGVMTVEAGGQMFGIPLDAIVETVRVSADSIVPVGAAHAIVLRNRTVPLVPLARTLAAGGAEPRRLHETTIVVAAVEGELAAIEVDRVGERIEVMLKPLEGFLSGMPGIAGSTLLGDGSVLLVLDLAELLQ
jgi:two-component system chemotaxis sensor kinase CheA